MTFDYSKIQIVKTVVQARSRTLRATWTTELLMDTAFDTGLKRRMKLNKDHFRHFLRLNNKRTLHTTSQVNEAKYTCIEVNYQKYVTALDWVGHNLKKGSVITSSNKFWFAYEKDAVIFAIMFK